MFDHTALRVQDYGASRAFYEAALTPIGWTVVWESPGDGIVGFGPDPAAPGLFWLFQREPPTTAAHIAFTCDDRATVDAFHAAGLAARGADNGAPGLRSYQEHYYAAFLLDQDGNNIEGVCHKPE